MANAIISVTANELADEVKRRFACAEPFRIAAECCLQVEYGEWFPATYGEFYAAQKRIVINRRAPLETERILAHELGHFFVREYKIGKMADEESFCESFAEALLRKDEND